MSPWTMYKKLRKPGYSSKAKSRLWPFNHENGFDRHFESSKPEGTVLWSPDGNHSTGFNDSRNRYQCIRRLDGFHHPPRGKRSPAHNGFFPSPPYRENHHG